MAAQKLTSILLCALIASTIAHDVLRAKHFAEEVRAKRAISPFEDRAVTSDPQQCEYQCTSTTTNNEFELYVNETTSLVGVVNITAKVAFIIDINANIITLLDGNNGAAVVINLKIQKGNYIAPGESDKTWRAEKVSFEVYFNSLVSLRILLNIGTVFSVDTCPTAILKVVAGLLVRLSVSLAADINANVKVALQILVKLGTSLHTLLTGALKGILQFAGKGAIKLFGDLVWLVGVLEGLGDFVGQITGGLAALIKAKIQLDLALLLGAASGIGVLVNLLLAIIVVVDISVVAGLLNNVEKLFEIVVKLGGGVSYGVTGLLKIVALVIKLLNKQIKIDALIQALLQFAAYRSEHPDREIDIAVDIEGLVQLVQVIKSSHGSQVVQLKVFIEIVEKLQKGTLVVKGVSISALIKTLASSVKVPLELVVSILILLGGVVGVIISIPTLLLILLQALTTVVGIKLLVTLGILAKTTNILSDIIAEILKSLKPSVIFGLIAAGFNLDAVLKAIPIVKDIYAALSAAVHASSNGSISVSVTIQASGSASVTSEIKTWVKSTLLGGQKTTITTTEKSGGGLFGGIIGGLFG